MKSRSFNQNSLSEGDRENYLWTETPEEKEKRLRGGGHVIIHIEHNLL